MELHKSQAIAIRHKDGPMMVLAGPGSGKTTVITHRVKTLIEEYGIDPSSILVITFTRAAADEMRKRFEKLNGGTKAGVTFGTFHSVFFTVLKYAYRYDASCIIGDDEKLRIIRELTEKYAVETDDAATFASGILKEISAVKGEMLNIDNYYAKTCSEDLFRKLYRDYEKVLRHKNKIDFDDMLTLCYDLFKERCDILALWRQKYRYILVDEFQDINRVQYEIVRMMAAPLNNLFIVGDDDQSIYGFRGANPGIMLGFPKDYPDAVRILLGVNYRSVKPVADAAGRLIKHNKTRFDKEITAARGFGHEVITQAFDDPVKEAAGITEEVMSYRKMGYSFSDIAVLFRMNIQPRLLTERLMEYNVPFMMRDVLPNLYDHWIAQDILAYIRVAEDYKATGHAARKDVLRIINRPNRYISRDCLNDPRVSFAKLKSCYRDRGFMVKRIETLENDLLMIAGLAPAAAVNYIRKGAGYDDYLLSCAESRHIKADDLIETAGQVQEGAEGHKTYRDWEIQQKEYADKLKEQAQERKVNGGVALMTMHSAKGLEFPVVFILDANETITPYRKAVLDADIEEERRMFYVAMTRARDRLHVCYVKTRYGKVQERSRFIDEYAALPDLKQPKLKSSI